MRTRTEMHLLQELVRLHRMGTGARKTARMLRVSPNTERACREAFTKAGLLEGDVDALPELEVLKAALPTRTPPQQVSSLEDLAEEVGKLLEKGCGPRAVYDHFRLSKPEFKGSYWALKRLCQRLERNKPVNPADVAVPVETEPGEVAQVDFGYVGRLFDPERQMYRKAWVFVMVLGYSRHQFAKVVFDQTTATWLRLHVEAFTFFGGVPEVIVPDNLKAAVVRAAFGLAGEPSLNRSYMELARHYGFKVDPTPPADPEKKGKVEAGVRYVGRSFFKPREPGEPVDVVNAELLRWVLEIAGLRLHGTTGKKPLEVFESEERATLKPLPALGWVPVTWKKAKVHQDQCVYFDKRLYTVEWHLVGQEAWVRATPDSVVIYVDDVRVGTHDRKGKGPISVDPAHLPPGRGDLRHRGRGYWEQRAAQLGDEVGAWVRERFDTDEVLSPLRTVQAVVTHLEKFPRSRAENACRRARFFGVTSYQGIKEILRKALDLEPLPDTLFPRPSEPGCEPRFVRPIAQMLLAHQEKAHDLQ
jgi:transposase